MNKLLNELQHAKDALQDALFHMEHSAKSCPEYDLKIAIDQNQMNIDRINCVMKKIQGVYDDK